MRRLVLICMMLLLPLQWSWAAAAAYCEHETGAAAQHLGHHEHKHQADASDKGGKNGKAASKTVVDDDCSVCHLSGLQWLDGMAAATVPALQARPHPVDQQALFSSHIPHGPERPDRSRIA